MTGHTGVLFHRQTILQNAQHIQAHDFAYLRFGEAAIEHLGSQQNEFRRRRARVSLLAARRPRA